jgi:hypothetical protein
MLLYVVESKDIVYTKEDTVRQRIFIVGLRRYGTTHEGSPLLFCIIHFAVKVSKNCKEDIHVGKSLGYLCPPQKNTKSQ